MISSAEVLNLQIGQTMHDLSLFPIEGQTFRGKLCVVEMFTNSFKGENPWRYQWSGKTSLAVFRAIDLREFV
jgi:hypothetical protein